MKPFLKYLPFLALLVWSCGDEKPIMPIDQGMDYFPLQTGQYAIYDVEEIVYSPLNEPETLAYELLTEVVDSFRNASDDYTYVVHRSKRTDESHPWEFFETWSVRKNDRETVVNEGNVPFVKLAFPLRDGRVWDGNKQNTSGEDEYQVIKFDQSYEVNNNAFTNTLTVEQESYDDLVTRTDERTEVYARGVGLVAKYTTQIIYCTEQICLNDRIIESGLIYKQQVKEYGIH